MPPTATPYTFRSYCGNPYPCFIALFAILVSQPVSSKYPLINILYNHEINKGTESKSKSVVLSKQ
ncbi:hypothetical protein E2C01_071012 [Portunus trituberculatus]|uniref:Uncharacterized protein n=1 Tax=Portunus trituberculatus TaxID=210409 RepID=A0A5B7I365_PORTR|nr:hypothetical protein [Portunus trituberculatus]